MFFSRLIHLFCLSGLLFFMVACDSDSSSSQSADTDGGAGTGEPECRDGVDNDNDGLVDGEDPGCANALDDDESEGDPPACDDGRDNDRDGLVDLDDPGCMSDIDDDETDVERPQCADGLDNDEDGDTDFPADRGCAAPADDDESDDPPAPECGDGLDNDSDGFIDYPADPGCGSEFDSSETDDSGPVRPQCSNGIDDDGDGVVDLADPGCSSLADPREANMEGELPACSNGLDDDGDGTIDFPYEPGCSAAGDEDETDPDMAPLCGNGFDDDNDSLIDFPDDPGCAGVGDRDESDPEVMPLCSDGIDNDRDGVTDYPDDRGCAAASDNTEGGACGRTYQAVEVDSGVVIRGDSRQNPYASEGSCGGRGAPEVVLVYRVTDPIESFIVRTDLPENNLETTLYIRRGCLDEQSEIACSRETAGDGLINNQIQIDDPVRGDYYIFVDGASGQGGDFAVVIDEVPLAACLNGLDDDEDGSTDYPFDPGCATRDDRDETDPDSPTGCLDGVDNDRDGLIDFPLDAGCQSAADNDEVDMCGQGLRIFDYPLESEFVIDSTDGSPSVFSGTCGPGGGPERIFVYENAFNARLTISTNHPETIARTTVYVRSECVSPQSEVACDTGEDADQKGEVVIDRAAPGTYFIFVDHPFGLGGVVKLSVDVERLPPGCSDEIDNDEDGFIDADDLGCSAPGDEDERDPEDNDARPICSDALDNDGDGLIDYPDDPGCLTRGFGLEDDLPEATECSNGVDDDDDGLIDYPADSGCSSAGDGEELNGRRPAQCTNRIDDDQDGATDYPNDPGCAAQGDLSEQDDPVAPACADGADNDRDGLVDFPYDRGCIAAGDRSEDDPAESDACSNGMDDDEDGIVDFPLDPGCLFAADDDETDPNFPPQCANGNDDDANGRIDFPDDPGCRFAGDNSERTDGAIQPRCSDGVDNDLDGRMDLADPGCINARDNDENDPEAPAFCADEIDNDEDGVVDWPVDDGCAAQGDECEQAGFGFCDGICQDMQANNTHCGRCNRTCSPGIECIDGRCGVVRPRVHYCGQNARYRPVEEFLQDEAEDRELIGANSCEPGDEVQAILVTLNGRNSITADAARYRRYLEDGGQIITSRLGSHEIYNALFGENIQRPARSVGRCQANIQNVTQLNPEDPFWADNIFIPVDPNLTGCGYPINNIPDVVLLTGWDAGNASLGYLDVGPGRIWFVESNWYDVRNQFTELSREMMTSMILGSGTGGAPPCLDGRDDDEDGLFDFDDPGCFGRDDPEEGDVDVPPACADGLDNDDDGLIDYPWEPGCIAAGDDNEADPIEVPECSNGLDDDGDGEPDYPFDPGCHGVGDDSERNDDRAPRCKNGRDDDDDGRIDYPADPGCSAASDAEEEDDLEETACADGRDNDRDGITDWPFDMGCESARDDDETDPEELPQCSNRIDDDEDERIDFPADPGCEWAADPREVVAGEAPACSNGVDDDADGLTDYPNDRGCRFAGDFDETDPFDPPARCEDGVDNDGDALVDLQDLGCENSDDDDEVDGDALPLCGDEIDNDEDGLLDWPADPGCQAQGDLAEEQSCREDLEVLEIPRNGTIQGATAEDDEDLYRNACGGREAPERVYRYVLPEAADRLTFSAANENTNFAAVVSVRRDCEEPRSQLACAGDFRRPEPTVVIENAEAGEYFVFIDGGGPERWVSSDGEIGLPPDPRNFAARNDINENCWGDGGNDAFDCYGRLNFTHNDVTQQLDVRPGLGRPYNIGGYGFTLDSELLGNVWKLSLVPAEPNDERLVNIRVTGDLGSDGGTMAATHNYDFQGRRISTFYTTDGGQFDPPVTHLLLPSDPEQLGQVQYANQGDDVTVTGNGLTLPVTFYVALSYANRQAVAAALLEDIEIQAGGGDPDAPVFGDFELTASEE